MGNVLRYYVQRVNTEMPNLQLLPLFRQLLLTDEPRSVRPINYKDRKIVRTPRSISESPANQAYFRIQQNLEKSAALDTDQLCEDLALCADAATGKIIDRGFFSLFTRIQQNPQKIRQALILSAPFLDKSLHTDAIDEFFITARGTGAFVKNATQLIYGLAQSYSDQKLDSDIFDHCAIRIAQSRIDDNAKHKLFKALIPSLDHQARMALMQSFLFLTGLDTMKFGRKTFDVIMESLLDSDGILATQDVDDICSVLQNDRVCIASNNLVHIIRTLTDHCDQETAALDGQIAETVLYCGAEKSQLALRRALALKYNGASADPVTAYVSNGLANKSEIQQCLDQVLEQEFPQEIFAKLAEQVRTSVTRALERQSYDSLAPCFMNNFVQVASQVGFDLEEDFLLSALSFNAEKCYKEEAFARCDSYLRLLAIKPGSSERVVALLALMNKKRLAHYIDTSSVNANALLWQDIYSKALRADSEGTARAFASCEPSNVWAKALRRDAIVMHRFKEEYMTAPEGSTMIQHLRNVLRNNPTVTSGERIEVPRNMPRKLENVYRWLRENSKLLAKY